jgi:hypothetical protein
MSDSSSTITAATPLSSARTSEPIATPKRKRRWLRWLSALFVGLVLLVIFLPTLAALPIFRGALLAVLFPSLKQRVALDELSLGWFSPIRAGGIRLQGDEGKTPALTIRKISGNATLWQMLTGGELGEFQIAEPAVFVEFDQSGSNWERLIKEIHGSPKLDRTLKLQITDAKVSLQGPQSPQPWSLDKLNTNVAFSPAVANSHGVPLIEGDKLVLMNNTELTPEICNDLLKYIVPTFAGVTRTSGRVSLAIDDYSWPIGKPDEASVQGELTLHSVEIGPGTIASSLVTKVPGMNLPNTFKVVRDDVVPFWIENGRVYHKNFAIGLLDGQTEPLVATEGSVGFDQSLDVVAKVHLPFSKEAPEGTIRNVLANTTFTVALGGKFDSLQLKLVPNGELTPLVNGAGDLIKRIQERNRENPDRPGLFRNRRRGNRDNPPPMP